MLRCYPLAERCGNGINVNQEDDEAAWAVQRHAMLQEVEAMATELNPHYGAPLLSQATLEALRRVPRHRFVPAALRHYAYLNQPLSIGHGQTISQPYIVALMTELLALAPGDRVLEVGTGCGYQSAVLAEVGAEVYSVEIIVPLAEQAASRLAELGYGGVQVRAGDGALGWPEHAPYAGIIVTAAAASIPPALVEQLRIGGRLVVPLGTGWEAQELMLICKDQYGGIHSRTVLPVRFVPLTGTGKQR